MFDKFIGYARCTGMTSTVLRVCQVRSVIVDLESSTILKNFLPCLSSAEIEKFSGCWNNEGDGKQRFAESCV